MVFYLVYATYLLLLLIYDCADTLKQHKANLNFSIFTHFKYKVRPKLQHNLYVLALEEFSMSLFQSRK